MKYVVIIFFIISCSDTPIEAPIDSYRDIKINIDMSSAIENGLFNKNNDTLKLQLDKSTLFQMQNEYNSKNPNKQIQKQNVKDADGFIVGDTIKFKSNF